ncbi:hypothetical protein SEA_STORMINNORM_60 [Gordonia Phage StorminNorm]|nr:hypothetical protein SEA_STORMINNORM_60 [Gordonia Phage StorminNorm]
MMMRQWKRLHRAYRVHAYRWRTGRAHLPKWRRWLPWGQYVNNLHLLYIELYLPGVGGVCASIHHKTSDLMSPHHWHTLRNSWLARADKKPR